MNEVNVKDNPKDYNNTKRVALRGYPLNKIYFVNSF